jgi:hypothetical protein
MERCRGARRILQPMGSSVAPRRLGPEIDGRPGERLRGDLFALTAWQQDDTRLAAQYGSNMDIEKKRGMPS